MNQVSEAQRKRRRRLSEAGFSLIELMVVIAIIAMLATIVGVNVMDALGQGDRAKAMAEIKTFETGLLAYRVAFKKLPSTEEGLNALVSNEKDRNFLDVKKIPLDPWGTRYVYELEGSRDFTIISYGADGVPGGEGEDADISNHDVADEE